MLQRLFSLQIIMSRSRKLLCFLTQIDLDNMIAYVQLKGDSLIINDSGKF